MYEFLDNRFRNLRNFSYFLINFTYIIIIILVIYVIINVEMLATNEEMFIKLIKLNYYSRISKASVTIQTLYDNWLSAFHSLLLGNDVTR